jgi:peptide deformylase
MILPIYAFGQPVLKKMSEDITPDHPGLTDLIANMWDTMYKANGIGLAAPQVGHPIRLFVVDTLQLSDKGKPIEGFKRVFINAHLVESNGSIESIEEGCLSIPDIRGDVERPPIIRLQYVDEQFQPFDEVFTGINARVIQHEYDHIEGVLFVERLKPLKRQLIRRKLENIRRGKIDVDYKMKFALK